MKFAEIRETYYVYSGKLSDVVRQLGLAGIAIIWIFKQEIDGVPSVPRLLVFAGVALAVGLACDLLQYALGTEMWLRFFHAREEEAAARLGAPGAIPFDPEEEDWDVPAYLNKIPIVFFWGKFISTLAGYVLILIFLIDYLRLA